MKLVAIFLLASIFLNNTAHATPRVPECRGGVVCVDETVSNFVRTKTDNDDHCSLTQTDVARCKDVCEQKKSSVKNCTIDPSPNYHNKSGEGTD